MRPTSSEITPSILTREEWLIAQAVIHACACANAAYCDNQLSVEARARIIAEVVKETSQYQRDSLRALVPFAQS